MCFAVSLPGGRATAVPPFHPRSQFLRHSSSFLFRMCMCYVCTCLLLPRPTFRSPRSPVDESSIARYCDRFLARSFLVSCFAMNILSYESTSCCLPGPSDNLPFLHAVDVDLKVGRFLVSLIPEIRWTQLGQSVAYGAIRSKRERSLNCNETMFS